MNGFWFGLLVLVLALLLLDLLVVGRRAQLGSSREVLALVLARLHYARLTLLAVFVFIGIKLLLAPELSPPLFFGLAAVVTALVLWAALSLFRERHEALFLAEDYRQLQDLALRRARRLLIVLAGATLLLVGVALLFLPGPGIPILLAGLALLATEFIWARRWFSLLREKLGLKPLAPKPGGKRR